MFFCFFRDCDSFFLSDFFQENSPLNLTEEECERRQNGTGRYECVVSEDNESVFVSNSWRMEEDENVSAELDDLEVRMDLTDDLLHMVLIALWFISSVFLCVFYS